MDNEALMVGEGAESLSIAQSIDRVSLRVSRVASCRAISSGTKQRKDQGILTMAGMRVRSPSLTPAHFDDESHDHITRQRSTEIGYKADSCHA